MVSHILVVGAGHSGLLAAVNLKAREPKLRVQVLRHPAQGDFEPAGLAATAGFADHLHRELGIIPLDFLALARPIWRLGTRYEWGPRKFFDHTHEFQIDTKYAALERETGFYVGEEPDNFEYIGSASARMSMGRAFFRRNDGGPEIQSGRFGYHLEPARAQGFLEMAARRMGVEMRDGKVAEVMREETGIAGVRLQNGEKLTADLYIDATGIQSLLLGQALGVPFIDYASSLLCDNALVSSWTRSDEPIQPHTMVTSMDSGWCWRTQHERFIACGYAYSSAHLDSQNAEEALRKIYPRCGAVPIMKMRQGRHEDCWVQNVVAVGNAAGFVEPLAAAGPGVLAFQCQWLAQSLLDCDRIVRPTIMKHFNKRWRRLMESDREFLGLFYRYNTGPETPFWQEARRKAHLGDIEEIVRCYQDIGPDPLHRHLLLYEGHPIGLEGYFSVLLGQNVPQHSGFVPKATELETWKKIQETWRRKAASGMSVAELLQYFQTEISRGAGVEFSRSAGDVS